MPQPKPSATLYHHEPHTHTPQNVNAQLAETRAKQIAASAREHGVTPSWRLRLAEVNERLAVWLTKHTGSMACAWLFAGIGVGSLIGVFTNNVFLAALFGSISSYFLQLVLLPVLSVGQNVLSRHAELQADEQFHATQRTLHESQQTMKHLDAQDAELLKQTEMLRELLTGKAATTTASVSSESAETPGATPKPQRTRSQRRKPTA